MVSPSGYLSPGSDIEKSAFKTIRFARMAFWQLTITLIMLVGFSGEKLCDIYSDLSPTTLRASTNCRHSDWPTTPYKDKMLCSRRTSAPFRERNGRDRKTGCHELISAPILPRSTASLPST